MKRLVLVDACEKVGKPVCGCCDFSKYEDKGDYEYCVLGYANLCTRLETMTPSPKCPVHNSTPSKLVDEVIATLDGMSKGYSEVGWFNHQKQVDRMSKKLKQATGKESDVSGV